MLLKRSTFTRGLLLFWLIAGLVWLVGMGSLAHGQTLIRDIQGLSYALQNVDDITYNLKTAYGAAGDGRHVVDLTVTSGSATATSATATFSASDKGKIITCFVGGTGYFQTTIASVNSATSVTMTANATLTTAAGDSWIGTDDTAAIQNAINAVQLTSNRLYVPAGYYLTTATPNISASITINGSACRPLWADTGSSVIVASNFPTVSPFIKGSVFVQVSQNVAGLKISGSNPTVNLRNLGILFASTFTSTGHGIDTTPPVNGTGYDNGMFDSDWDNVIVFGHDGNHYALNLVNAQYNTINHFRGYGGGGIHIYSNSPLIPTGNLMMIHPYCATGVNGTAHGIYLDTDAMSSTHQVNMVCMIRPQIWVQDVTALTQWSWTTAPTSAQKLLNYNGATNRVAMIAPDFETNVSSTASYPYGGNCWFTPMSNGAVDPLSNSINTGTVYQNTTGCGVQIVWNGTFTPTGAATAEAQVAIGPTNTPATNTTHVIIPINGPVMTLPVVFTVPEGYYFKITIVGNVVRESCSHQRMILP